MILVGRRRARFIALSAALPQLYIDPPWPNYPTSEDGDKCSSSPPTRKIRKTRKTRSKLVNITHSAHGSIRNLTVIMPSKEAVLTDKAPAPLPFFSQAIKCQGMVYCSGSIGMDPATNSIVEGSISARTVRGQLADSRIHD
jgi:hypothetical protein